jgi:hypothetical protein
MCVQMAASGRSADIAGPDQGPSPRPRSLHSASTKPASRSSPDPRLPFKGPGFVDETSGSRVRDDRETRQRRRVHHHRQPARA